MTCMRFRLAVLHASWKTVDELAKITASRGEGMRDDVGYFEEMSGKVSRATRAQAHTGPLNVRRLCALLFARGIRQRW